MIHALNRYLLLKPDDPDMHWFLAMQLKDDNVFDLAVEHMQKSLALLDAIKSPPAGLLELKREREEEMRRFQAEVTRRASEVELATARAKELEKVAVLVRVGLVAKAKQQLDNIKAASLSEVEQQQHKIMTVLVTMRGVTWR